MTRWCTARPNGRPTRCGRRSKTGWRSGSGIASGQNPDRVLQGRQATWRLPSTRRSRSWATRSSPAAPRIGKGGCCVGFLPAVSAEALTAMVARSAAGGCTGGRPGAWTSSPDGSIRSCAGWMNYYGRFYRSKLTPLLQRINTYLMRWAGRSTSGCGHTSGSRRGGSGSSIENPNCSRTGGGSARSPGWDEKSGVTGDCHAPFRGSPGVRFPRATRLSSLVDLVLVRGVAGRLGWSQLFHGWRSGRARVGRSVGVQAGCAGGVPVWNTLCHRQSQASAWGQWVGRRSTGRCCGRTSRAGTPISSRRRV